MIVIGLILLIISWFAYQNATYLESIWVYRDPSNRELCETDISWSVHFATLFIGLACLGIPIGVWIWGHLP